MKKVALVTGSAGFIGSNLCEALIKKGYTVTGIDNLSTGRVEYIMGLDMAFFEGSITDLTFMRPLFEGVDYVFHQAALPSVPRSINDPLASNNANVNGTLKVLVAARDAGVKKVIYASSSSVYGDSIQLPKNEDMATRPMSPYAVSKLAGENYCMSFKKVYGLETVALRYFNVFGRHQTAHSAYSAVIPLFVSALMEGKNPIIYGDGKTSRDFTYIKNVVDANILFAENDATGVFNIACGERHSLNELIKLIGITIDKPYEVTYNEERVGDVKHSLADISKAEREGYKPKYNLEQGLRDLLL
jgi:UDP-glucose 4-epimerase